MGRFSEWEELGDMRNPKTMPVIFLPVSLSHTHSFSFSLLPFLISVFFHN